MLVVVQIQLLPANWKEHLYFLTTSNNSRNKTDGEQLAILSMLRLQDDFWFCVIAPLTNDFITHTFEFVSPHSTYLPPHERAQKNHSSVLVRELCIICLLH